MLDKATTGMQEVIDKIVTFFQELPEKIWEHLCTIVSNVVEWSLNMRNEAQEMINGFFRNIVDKLSQLPGEFWNWLCDVISNVISWAVDMNNKANSAVSDFFNTIINKIRDLPGEVWNWLCDVVSRVGDFAWDVGNRAADAASNIWNAIVDGISGLPGQVYSIGSDIVYGIWNGIGDVCGWLWNQISGFCDEIWNNIAGFFGIASPSKLFKEELGYNLDYGLAEGVDAKVKDVIQSVSDMGEDVMTAAQKSLSADWNVGSMTAVPTSSAGVTNNYYNTDNSRTINQTNNSPKALSRLEIYRQTRNAIRE